MLGPKAGVNKFKIIKIIQSLFSDHNGMKLKIKTRRRKFENFTNIWKLTHCKYLLIKKELTM